MGSLVFCIHHKEGCKWSDELRKLKVRRRDLWDGNRKLNFLYFFRPIWTHASSMRCHARTSATRRFPAWWCRTISHSPARSAEPSASSAMWNSPDRDWRSTPASATKSRSIASPSAALASSAAACRSTNPKIVSSAWRGASTASASFPPTLYRSTPAHAREVPSHVRRDATRRCCLVRSWTHTWETTARRWPFLARSRTPAVASRARGISSTHTSKRAPRRISRWWCNCRAVRASRFLRSKAPSPSWVQTTPGRCCGRSATGTRRWLRRRPRRDSSWSVRRSSPASTDTSCRLRCSWTATGPARAPTCRCTSRSCRATTTPYLSGHSHTQLPSRSSSSARLAVALKVESPKVSCRIHHGRTSNGHPPSPTRSASAFPASSRTIFSPADPSSETTPSSCGSRWTRARSSPFNCKFQHFLYKDVQLVW